jgi:molecular chaperone GrpE
MSTEQIKNEEMINENEQVEHNQTDANQSENNPDSTPNEEIETVESVKAFWNDKYARLAAEFDNFRKRTNKEISDVIKSAGKDVIISLLEVVDDYDRAKVQIDKAENIDAVKEGINLIFNKLSTTLKGKGLEEMQSTNENFNPDFHEAIAEIPAPNADMVNKVIDTVQKGYLLNGKIIRHAKVVVGKSQD